MSLKQFKYNLSFYYQSLIIYLSVFIVYVLVREFNGVGVSELYTNDPLIYFFTLIILVAAVILVYNLIRNKVIEIDDKGFTIQDRFKKRVFDLNSISAIKIVTFKFRRTKQEEIRHIKVALKNRRLILKIRPNLYQDSEEFIESFKLLKSKVENKNV